jgi:hypothetical protein
MQVITIREFISFLLLTKCTLRKGLNTYLSIVFQFSTYFYVVQVTHANWPLSILFISMPNISCTQFDEHWNWIQWVHFRRICINTFTQNTVFMLCSKNCKDLYLIPGRTTCLSENPKLIEEFKCNLGLSAVAWIYDYSVSKDTLKRSFDRKNVRNKKNYCQYQR